MIETLLMEVKKGRGWGMSLKVWKRLFANSCLNLLWNIKKA